MYPADPTDPPTGDICRFLNDNDGKIIGFGDDYAAPIIQSGDQGHSRIARHCPLDMIAAVRRGLSHKAVSRVAEALHITTSQLAVYLPVTERTL